MGQPSAIDQLVQRVEGLTLAGLAQKYPSTHPEYNSLDLYRAHLSGALSKISGVDTSIIFPVVMWTQSLEKGDFVVAVPALRIKGSKPDLLAQEWAAKFPEDDPLFAKPVLSGHFMSFFMKAGPLIQSTVPIIRQARKEYGKSPFHGLRDPKDQASGQKRIIVEFSSPNVAKPFHAGHLRSTIIGSFIANLYEACGWDVIRMNYLGDWGKQYGLLALAYERNGNEEELKKNPIDHLFKLYVQINAEMAIEKASIEAQKKEGKDVSALEAQSLDEQARQYFKRMTDNDPAVLAQWQRFRDLSIARYKAVCQPLHPTVFAADPEAGESQVSEAYMSEIAEKMKQQNITKEDNGAVLIDFTQHLPGKEGKRLGTTVLRKRDGTALYLTRDICELLGRNTKYGFDHMIYVVASQQDLHLKQLFQIIELLGYKDIAKKCQHINFGMVLGMSTRKGTVKFLDDILKDCAEHMHETMKKNQEKYAQIEDPDATADILGISSVMVQDMSGKRINNYEFNMDAMTSFEGDTGPYLQYAHARLCSIRRRVSLSDEELDSADLTLLQEEHAVNITRMLSQWPDVLQNTLKTLEPATVLTYLFKMTHVISSSYDHLKVIGSEPELMKARMALYDAARITLANGMRILGLTPLER
ncbi:arginyl-tRNA synthetase [Moelleriella libera RCEF 2490]|uniref:arginine--tRNA ligase n=1 Tax=Moelleriella libera RCEF 2490 TaxID=1081109 RepID=A0A168B536_9HYPO|nr:arginyl-tRNA synthetase [Moelleriella libera RCEF 2490]